MEKLKVIQTSSACSLYEITSEHQNSIRRFVVSTPQTRSLCNDPFIVGLSYTDLLRDACAETLKCLKSNQVFLFDEVQTSVLHVLRGGLNFGLREALGQAFSWNQHSSAFISAQRARRKENPEEWLITENDYVKINLPAWSNLIFGDVVATGTSLLYALKRILDVVEKEQNAIQSILFFTIGSYQSEKIIKEIDLLCKARFAEYREAAIVYFEGRFDVATQNSKLSVKHTGTDLIRSNSLLAPEFINSQYDNPSFPIQRCTIYDAGSRAFWLPEYFADVKDYWDKTLQLAESGLSYHELLKERFPELEADKFGKVDLLKIAEDQLEKFPKA